MIAPATTLLLFLAGSVLHLGLGDTEEGLLPATIFWPRPFACCGLAGDWC
jgi:hypothetical protein